ncbi:MAG: hypothetical protein ACOCSF_07935, partial [Halanaeroarchaeum sp.]
MRTSSSSSSGSDGNRDGAASTDGDVRIRSNHGVLALLVVPWTVVHYPGGASLVFPLWSATTNPLHATFLWAFVARQPGGMATLPSRLFAWPLATLLLGVAVLGAVAGLVGREDRRLTAGTHVLAGLVHLRVTLGLAGIG